MRKKRNYLISLVIVLTLLPTSQAKALTIDLETLLKEVSQVLTDVGGSPAVQGQSDGLAGNRTLAGQVATETHPTPAVQQEGTLPPPPAPAPSPRPQTAPPPQPTKAGKASWYGERFAGRKTASGERFNPQAMTTAHKSLPFGTDLEVCRKGQCVEVRVTDRGPFTPGRSLDLSRAAFAELAPTSKGVINVEWRVL